MSFRKDFMQDLQSLVVSHSKKMRVVVDSTRTKCVDGGYQEDEAVGATAFAGAHLGVSMALLKLGFSPEDSFNLVYKYVVKNGNSYCWHTDTHEGHGCVVGCGHCNAAIGNSEHYGVSGDDVQKLLDVVRKAQEDKDNMEKVTLDREHAEQAILVITSTDYTVKPWDQGDDVQFFIYDKVRHLELLKSLVESSKEDGVEISYDDLVKVSDEQTNATLGLLGSSKGKSIFTVDVSGSEPVVELVGEAPVIDE
jgi:hypothetical protein